MLTMMTVMLRVMMMIIITIAITIKVTDVKEYNISHDQHSQLRKIASRLKLNTTYEEVITERWPRM